MKLIHRQQYPNRLQGVMNTPDIKIVTGIRRYAAGLKLICVMEKEVLKRLFALAFLLFAGFAVSAESDTGWRVAVSGKVVNMSDKSARVITAINCNPWSDEISRHAVEIDSAGRFNTYVEIPFGHNFTIHYDRSFFCQYAEPGDSLFLTIDASNPRAGARYAGSHEKLNNEYGKVYADIFHKSFVDLPSGEMPKEAYLDYFKEICTGLDDILNNYADSVGMSEEPKDLMRRSFLFTVANSALDHRDKTPERVLEFFEDPIFGLDDERNLREMMFTFHLHAYLNRLEMVVRPDTIFQMVDAIVERHPKSLNRDVMLAILLKESDEGDGYPQISRELFTNPGIYRMLYGPGQNKELLPNDNLHDGKILEFIHGEAVDSDYSSLSELLKNEFSGKIVYLDLWATWCGPCIESNKSLPEVADFFKGKDIVFVSVAMSSDLNKWKRLISGHPQNCRDFFINSGTDAELIMSKFGMNGFPKYLIINKDSEIINRNPPRPNNSAIFEYLLKLL